MVLINGILWYIFYVPWNDRNLYREDGSLTIGMCDNNTRTIYICNSLDDMLMKKVLCHELTHASMFSYGVYLTRDQEELVADLLSTYGEEIIDKANLIFGKLKGELF